MDFYLYTILSGVYIMVIYFAVGTKKEFNLYLTIASFFVSGIIGWWFKSWELGLVLGVIFSLIFY